MPSPTVPTHGSGREAWVRAVIGADDEWLVELFSSRPDLALSAPASLGALVEALIEPGSVLAFYDMADRSTRQVLDALCVLPSPTQLEALAVALGGDAGSLRPVVERLVAAGLVLAEMPGTAGSVPAEVPGTATLLRNPGLPRAIPNPAGLAGSAREMLSRYPVGDLSEMAARLGVVARGAKAGVLETLAQALSSPERMAGAVRAGPEGTERLARRLSSASLEVGLSWGMHETARSDRTPEGWLLRRAMLVPTMWGSATMPAEVALALRGGRLFDSFSPDGPPLTITALDPARTDRRAAEVALTLVGDVAAVLEAWAVEPAKLLRSGGLGVREVRRVAKLTGRSEPDSARLVDLMTYAGLADVDGELVLPAPEYDQWSEQPVGARWAQLAEGWCDVPLHLSLAGAIGTNEKPIPPLLDRPPELDALARRQFVLSLLVELPPGQAVERVSAAARLAWRRPALWEGGPALPEMLISWALDEAEMVGLSVEGASSSFGRQLMAGDAGGAAAALGAFAPPVTSEVVLQADLTAVASGELAPDLRRELDLLADVESAGAATVYRFSEASLRRGFDAGRSAEQMLAWLAEHAPKGVPQPLRYLVDDLARRFGRARVGAAASYLRSDDPALVAEVVRARKTARLHLRLLAPTVAVSDVEPATAVATLRDAGYLAAPEEADGTLTLTRPPARRAPPRSDDQTTDDLLDNAEMLAAFVGLPASSLPPGLVTALERLMADEPAGPAGGGEAALAADGDPFDVAALVARLRGAPRSALAPGGLRSPSGPPATPAPFPQLELLEAELSRPTHIAKQASAVVELLDQALAEDWTVRLSYVDSRGDEKELYAEPLEVNRQSIRVRCFPNGGVRTLRLPMIQWMRVATEAEEEMLFA
jgi:hypothetical protein